MASNVVPVTVTGDTTVYTPAAGSTGVGTLYGWSFRSTAGATVYIRAGIDDTAPIIAAITLAANGFSTEWFGPQGVQSRNGIRVDASAAIEGAVFIA
jgi:hypothetical protein